MDRWLISLSGAGLVSLGCAAGVTCNKAYGVYNTSAILTTQWESLPRALRKAATTCGFDQRSWDGPVGCSACFANLSEEQQQAILEFGTDEACNDKAMNLQGFNCTIASKPERSQDGHCDVSHGVYFNSLEEASKTWDNLPSRLKAAATTCGASKSSWDGPSECRACFSDLGHARQQAVLDLGTDAECHDLHFKHNWGIDCQQFVLDVPKATERHASYLKLSKLPQTFPLHSKISFNASGKAHRLRKSPDLWVTLDAVSAGFLLLTALLLGTVGAAYAITVKVIYICCAYGQNDKDFNPTLEHTYSLVPLSEEPESERGARYCIATAASET